MNQYKKMEEMAADGLIWFDFIFIIMIIIFGIFFSVEPSALSIDFVYDFPLPAGIFLFVL